MIYTDTGAELSRCKRYRYKLWRTWNVTLPRCVFVMLNPSTADGQFDDPTIRSCVRIAHALGFGGIFIVNLYAWRSTEPTGLPLPPSKARGPGNVRAVHEALKDSVVICAWGASKYAETAAPGMLSAIALHKRKCYCLGRTKSGAPRHPLYVPSNVNLDVYKVFR